MASMGISTYVRVNNFQFSRRDEVHFKQRNDFSPKFCSGVVELRRRFAFARQPKQRPDAHAVACQP
jgi:hypothetical protein